MELYKHSFFNYSPFTPVYGLSRSMLAMGTLITLAFTDFNLLIDHNVFSKLDEVHKNIIKFNIFRLFDLNHIYIAKILAIVILILVISGYFPRITGLLHWWVAFSFNSISILVDGGDQLAAVLTLLLIPVTLLDGRKNHWYQSGLSPSLNSKLIGNSFLFIISIQMSIVYLQAGVEKMYKLNEWVSGTAIYYFMNDPLFGSPNWVLPVLSPILNSKFGFFVCWGVIILELTLAAALFMDKTRKLKLFYIAVLFHLLIIINLGLFSFFFSMVGGIIIYLLPWNYKIMQIKDINKVFNIRSTKLESGYYH